MTLQRALESSVEQQARRESRRVAEKLVEDSPGHHIVDAIAPSSEGPVMANWLVAHRPAFVPRLKLHLLAPFRASELRPCHIGKSLCSALAHWRWPATPKQQSTWPHHITRSACFLFQGARTKPSCTAAAPPIAGCPRNNATAACIPLLACLLTFRDDEPPVTQ